MHEFLKFIFGIKLYMFRTFPLSIVRSFSLYTQQWYMSYSLRAGSGRISSQAVSKPVWHIPLLCVQWKTPDDGQRKCPKHVQFYSKNKFDKLARQLVLLTESCLTLTQYSNCLDVLYTVVFSNTKPWIPYFFFDLPIRMVWLSHEHSWFCGYFRTWFKTF